MMRSNCYYLCMKLILRNNFEWIPLITCYNPPAFKLYYDDNTPEWARWNHPQLPEEAEISEKPKNDWEELVTSMRGSENLS